MRQYQEDIYNALVKKGNWFGNKTGVATSCGGVSEVYYCMNKIAVVDHHKKSAKLDNCGFTNASTTARLNAVRDFCKDYEYSIKEV